MPFDTVVARNDRRLAVVYKSSFIAGTLLTGLWLWMFYRRDYPYLTQHMIVALSRHRARLAGALSSHLFRHWRLTGFVSSSSNPTEPGRCRPLA